MGDSPNAANVIILLEMEEREKDTFGHEKMESQACSLVSENGNLKELKKGRDYHGINFPFPTFCAGTWPALLFLYNPTAPYQITKNFINNKTPKTSLKPQKHLVENDIYVTRGIS